MTQSMVLLRQFVRDLYAAETPRDAGCALLRAVPYWLPFVSTGACITTYIAIMRLRLFIAKWRRTTRRRAERKYRALGHLHNGIPPPCSSFTLVEDDDDDDENDNNSSNTNRKNNNSSSSSSKNNLRDSEDITRLSMLDIEEFCRSLGIRSPRDDDLLIIVEAMLLVDPIPDGWVLYRTTAGVVRFMNINTQELFFFHPDKHGEERHIRDELQQRNKACREAKYKFSYSSEEGTLRNVASIALNTPFVPSKQYTKRRKHNDKIRGTDNEIYVTAPVSFSDRESDYDYYEDNDDDVRDAQSTFGRIFHYFVEREERKIERDVERQFRHSTAVGTSSDSGTPLFDNRSSRLVSANTVYTYNYSNTHSKRESSS